MRENSISLELKKQITPSIFVIGQEYYNKSLGNITALFADGNFLTVEGEYKENSLCKTSITMEQKKGEFVEANCDCMFFKNSKKNCCKHVVTLGMMADHSEKISKVIGTDEIEMMFEDDFEEDNKKLAKIKEKEQKVKTEKVVKQNLVNDNKNKSRQRIKLKDKNLNIKKLDKSSEFFEKIGNIENNELQSIVKKSKSSEARFEIIEGNAENIVKDGNVKVEMDFQNFQKIKNNEEILENLESVSEKINEIYNLHVENQNIEVEEQQEMRLEVEIDEGSYSDYKYGYDYNQENTARGYILRLKTGLKKTYYVKDILKFIEAIVKDREYEITSKITYNPKTYFFNEVNKKIIHAIYEYSKEIQSVIDSGIKDKKGLKVYEMLLNRLLAAMEKGKSLILLGEQKQIMNSYEPLFILENDKIIMRNIEKISENSPFYTFSNDTTKVFKMDKNEMRFFEKFDFLDMELFNQLPWEENQKLRAVLEYENINVAEYIDEDGNIDIFVTETDEKELVKINLSNTVCAVEKNGKYFIPRKNVSLFEELKKHVESYSFVNMGLTEDTYNVNYEGLGKISEYIDKMHADKVKIHLDNKIKNARNIDVHIGIKKVEHNFLNVSFDIEGIKTEDVEIVMEAIKNEQKYITLSSGELVKIANKSIEELVGITDSISNLKVGENKISKIKALQLAQISKNIQDELVKMDEFKGLFHKIKNRQEIEPNNINVELFPYQKLGFNWLKNMYDIGFGGILADDMGLGKTLQTISLLNEIYQENRGFSALIIVPSSLLYNWKEEIIKFTGINPTLIEGTAAQRKEIISRRSKGFLITTYQALRNDIEEYKSRDFDIVVLDEAQNIKTTTSQIKKAVMKINSKVNFALTGTPVENNILELWSIFDFVIPGYLDNLTKFKKTYKEAIVNPNSSKIHNLREIIAPFLLRRTKKEVLTELPDKIESNMVVTLSNEQKQLYMSYIKQAKSEMKKFNENENNRMKILAILTKLRQICNSPTLFKEDYKGDVAKLEVLRDLLPDITENGHRLLIFSQFVGTLKEIEKELASMGIEYFYIDGSVKSKERVDICNRFNAGERQVVLISLKAGGTGLNLVGADVVIHYDPWWNIAVENQASDRAYRIGQKKSVQVIKLVTEGTIEEKIIKIQENKRQLSENLLESKDGEKVLFEMSDKELMELLS
ncbi:non-specific serine/threonine protein kinase [Leptotrichia trevisanii]|uniref:Non-specific serine/threonine protein kinase n=1 Tax=Leptotrichia trevisanii TaxID=109328 RepID=A0A510KYT5_9FUSO|nr:DEAD/DEAH box helicase [Leptotrichia trevisanii]BBM51955.1 non-specific serine/threonine protein kinase [Leptotrichia trevisanii]BBM56900.1 non-specific serine/threonine protein kinase [Leptotrichia trevisanii]